MLEVHSWTLEAPRLITAAGKVIDFLRTTKLVKNGVECVLEYGTVVLLCLRKANNHYVIILFFEKVSLSIRFM